MTTTPISKRPCLYAPSSVLKETPLRSILRTGVPASVLGPRTRDDQTPDDDDEAESPTKRRKTVAFDMSQNMVIHIGSRSLEETKREVRQALEGRARGDDEGYDALKEIFANDRQRYLQPVAGEEEEEEDRLKPGELVVYVVALIPCVPMMGKPCSSLIKTILKCAWLGRDEDFTKAYIQFLAALCSAQGSCLEPVLSMFVEQFRESKPPAWDVPDFPAVEREAMKQRLHAGLRYILGLFPAAKEVLFNLVTAKYPCPEERKSIHTSYIDNILRLREYAPDLGPDLMELITNRLSHLDVQMQLDLEDLHDETSSAVAFQLQASRSKDCFDEEDSEDSDLESMASDDSDYDQQAHKILVAKNTVQKLDATLDTLFSLYTSTFKDPASDAAQACFVDLVSEFINIILPTQSRHVQFLVFHFAQRSPQLTDMFIGTLLNIAFEQNRSLVLKQAAAAYLASFVARGAHVSTDKVTQVVDVLCSRIEAYRLTHKSACRGPDLRRFTPIYAWTQALLYIFCFRWRDLITASPDNVDPDDPTSYLGREHEWIPHLQSRLKEAIFSVFNPLKVCSPPIVTQFVKLAGVLQFMFCHHKVDQNKRVILSQFASGAYSNGGALRESGYDPRDEQWLQLEAHFPFDPYQLPISKRWLEGDYTEWTRIAGLDRDEDDEEENSDLEDLMDDDEDIEENTATDDENVDD